MRCADARQAAWDDFAALGYKLAEQPVVLVVDVFDLLDTEFANFLAPEEFTAARSAFTRPAGSAPGTAKSRTVSARPSAFAAVS